MTNPQPAVTKLRPEHTRAGVTLTYDDHTVFVRHHGQEVSRWTHHAELKTIVAWVDTYLAGQEVPA